METNRKEWSEDEILEVINIFATNFEGYYLEEIKRNVIVKMYSNFTFKDNHTEQSFIALVYNIVSILTNEQYGLSGFSKKLKDYVEKSQVKFSKENEKFYIDDEIFDDIDSNLVEDMLEEANTEKGETYEDFYNQRIIPIFNSIDIEAFILMHSKKKYNLEPDFQRNDVWSPKKKQLLIESIFSSIPIPQIYSYELRDQKIEIVDGKQRLRTIIDFYNNNLKLDSKFKFIDMRNKFFSDLNEEQKNWFLNFSLNFMKIPYKEFDEKIKYDIFDKLNNNSVVLNFQELRNSIYRSKLNDRIKELSTNDELINNFLPCLKMKRMQNIEMLYRFLSLKSLIFFKDNKYYLSGYKGIKDTIDLYMKKWTKIENDEIIEKEINLLKEAFKTSFNLFGLDAFKSYDADKNKWKNSINRPLMDAVLLNSHLLNQVKNKQNIDNVTDKIKLDLKNLFINDPDFMQSFSSATGNSKSIELKINKINEIYVQNFIK